MAYGLKHADPEHNPAVGLGYLHHSGMGWVRGQGSGVGGVESVVSEIWGAGPLCTAPAAGEKILRFSGAESQDLQASVVASTISI